MSDASPIVLVVDDNDAARFVKCRVLTDAGMTVRAAATGTEAIAMASAEPVDLVVLDVNLPDIHGFDVCRRLKDVMTHGIAVHVLQVSNTAITARDAADGLRVGADAYLTEPIHPDVLVATARALLRTRHAEVALARALERERAARHEAEDASRSRDEFLAMLSHELRTPLNAIMGWIWQLKRGSLSEASARRAIDSIERNSRVQSQIINDLLDVSRIAKGKLQLELRVVNLQRIIEAAADSVRDQATRKGVSLALPSQSVSLTADANRLQQVFTNLLTNAIQFTPSGGSITVTTDAVEDHVVVAVRDSGAGIAPEFLAHVFDVFRQAEGGMSRKHGGLGLGLAIVRQLVEMHGGSVSVSSDGLGHGATFSVTLPANPSEQVLDDDIPAGPLLADISVLVVDDDPDARELLAAMLESSGARATTVSSAAGAREILADQSFDVLVSDIGMPGVDGVAFLRGIRQDGYTMPAVAVTAYTSATERETILGEGYQLHVPKPIQAASLIRGIAALLAPKTA